MQGNYLLKASKKLLTSKDARLSNDPDKDYITILFED